MSRKPEGSFSTPERTPSYKQPNLAACPTHTPGHPTILFSQFSTISPPITPVRHQSPLNSSKSPSTNAFEDSFQLKLWSLVPLAFRPQPEDIESVVTTPPKQTQRPCASDIIDQSERLQTTPKSNRFFSLSELEAAASPAETTSPSSPNHKRRNSGPSSNESSKRRSKIDRECSRESSTSPSIRPILGTKDRNPFEVHDNSCLDNNVSELNLFPLQHTSRIPNIQHSSQQLPKTSWRSEQTTPPPLRYRCASLDPETPPKLSPTLLIRAAQVPFNMLEQESVVGSAGDPADPRDLTSSSSKETVSPHSSRVDISKRHPSPGPVDESCMEISQRTPSSNRERMLSGQTPKNKTSHDLSDTWKSPTWRLGRRLSMSSVSTKSPPSEKSATRQLLYRRLSLCEPDSPSVRTPTKPWRISELQSPSGDDSPDEERINSILDSPSTGMQWSPSLETPKRRLGQGEPNDTAKTSIIQRLRGLQPPGLFEESAMAVEGWSTSLETPPRRAIQDKQSEPERKVSGDILERLRGNPHSSHLSSAQVSSHVSQDERFYSASPIVSETEDCPREQRGENCDLSDSGANDTIEDADVSTQEFYKSGSELNIEFNPKLDDSSLDMPSISQDTDVGLTLPSSLVHQLEQESLDMGSQDFQSQIFPDSQSDNFESIASAEFDNAFLSRSNETSQQSQIFTDITMDGETTPTNGYIPDCGLPPANQRSIRDEILQRFAPPSENILSSAQHFTSQGFNEDNVRIESWAASVPHGCGHHADLNANQDIRQSPEIHREQDSAGILSDDDFDNIRFSQLDDGFNSVPEATQRLQGKSPAPAKAEKTLSRIDDDEAWLSTSANMLSDLGSKIERVHPPHVDSRETHPPFGGGGFKTAHGKKLEPISKSALVKAANLFGDDDISGFNNGPISPKREDNSSASVGGPMGFSGFRTAGKKTLLPISDAMRQKVAFLFEDEDVSIEGSSTTSHGRAAISTQPVLSKIAPSGPTDGQVQSFSGFISGNGKKLAGVSKEALEKWKSRFAEDDESDLAMPRSGNKSEGPGRVIQPPAPQMGFTGFSSGKGKALAPISKAAKDRALSVLEMDESSLAPLIKTGFGNVSNITAGNSKLHPGIPEVRTSNVAGSFASKSVQQPIVSSHMNNLKLKSIRATSGPLSISGISKPLNKSRTAFKSPLAFKPPLKKPVASLPDKNSSIDININNQNIEDDTSVSAKKQTNRRMTLHPNARPISTEPTTPNVAQSFKEDVVTPSHKPVFDLQIQDKRTRFCELFNSPQQHGLEELSSLEVPDDAINMTLESAQSYRFDNWGIEQAFQDLVTRGAAPNLLSNVWLKNHYGLIVWKLACYVRTWPRYFHPSGISSSAIEKSSYSWFSPAKVLDQLLYRYEREINRAERPALRKIVEGDESAAKHMVLCIASISREYSEEIKQDVWKVAVTDGWYILPATLDVCLIRALENGKKLKVGSKIHVCRAKLSGAENGVAILELSGAGASITSVSIVLQANSTKLARWDAKLGFQRAPLIWTRRLQNILPEGGLVPGLDVVVLRKYPVIYLETLDDGFTKIKRTVIEEEKAAEVHREQIQKQYQDIVLQVEKEFGAGGSQTDQTKIQEEVQVRAGKLLQAGNASRNVTPFFTIRVGNCIDDESDHEGAQLQEALVTFWHSDHAPYKEGQRVRITSLMAKKPSRETGFDDMIQLTGTRMSTVREMPMDPDLALTSYRPREITKCSDIGNLNQGAETDIAVVILACGETVINSNKVYFIATDTSKQLILVEHQLSSSSSGADFQLPTFLKIQSKILMTNARFKLRDHKLGLDIVSSLTSYTTVSLAPPITGTGSGVTSGVLGWPVYAQSSLLGLNELCNKTSISNSEKEETLLELMAKANMVLERMRPSF
ncbi:hypothetical protein BGZ46_006067 [Entomortierella lignicola]|nr:hypothetical protein BGZ46_006067 [Entomortierella lignicola]